MKLTIKYIYGITIALVCVIGDKLVSNSNFSHSFIYRAVMDNFTHAVIGFFSALLFLQDVESNLRLPNVILCTLVASLIDIDHVFVAKSLSIKDLSNIPQRGALHYTTLWIAISTLLFLYAFIQKQYNVYLATFMVVIAFSSHHVRDAVRRGFSLYPFQDTKAINSTIYILSCVTMPFLYSIVFRNFKGYFIKDSFYSNLIEV